MRCSDPSSYFEISLRASRMFDKHLAAHLTRIYSTSTQCHYSLSSFSTRNEPEIEAQDVVNGLPVVHGTHENAMCVAIIECITLLAMAPLIGKS